MPVGKPQVSSRCARHFFQALDGAGKKIEGSLPEIPRCWSCKLERRAGRAAALAEVTPAIEATFEVNMDADDILCMC